MIRTRDTKSRTKVTKPTYTSSQSGLLSSPALTGAMLRIGPFLQWAADLLCRFHPPESRRAAGSNAYLQAWHARELHPKWTVQLKFRNLFTIACSEGGSLFAGCCFLNHDYWQGFLKIILEKFCWLLSMSLVRLWDTSFWSFRKPDISFKDIILYWIFYMTPRLYFIRSRCFLGDKN